MGVLLMAEHASLSRKRFIAAIMSAKKELAARMSTQMVIHAPL
ncbi:hypothetical protein [Herbaspirillum sp. RV1423]|nr:hypothetical protein [Herbaspirillum sp. RV1423]